MDEKELIKTMQDSINDPTGLRRYLEATEEIDDERHEEAMQLNKKIYYITFISCVASVVSLVLSLWLALST